MLFPGLLALVIATPPGGLSDLDLANIEGSLIHRIQAAPSLELARGDTVFVELSQRVHDLPEGEISPHVISAAKPPKVAVLDWTDHVETAVNRGISTVRLQVILRADPSAPLGSYPLDVKVEVLDRVGHTFGILNLRASVRVVEPSGGPPEVSLAEKAYLHHLRAATEGLRAAPSLSKFLRPHEVGMPASAEGLTQQEQLVLRGILKSRLRAEIARDRLRAFAGGAPGPVADQALLALATAHPRPTADKRREIRDRARLLEASLAALAELDLEEAERGFVRLRGDEKLETELLPDVLAGLGATAAARNDIPQAEMSFGQALTLRPNLVAPARFGRILKAFDTAKKRTKSTKALAMHSAVAIPVETDDGPGLKLRVIYGPDQHHLVDRGTLELIGPGGGVLGRREVMAERGDLASLEAIFTPAEVGTLDKEVLVRSTALDVVGLEVASFGKPAPARVALEVETEDHSSGLPWWLWAVGGVAVAGAATAVAVGVSGHTQKPAIGPIDVRF
ncbi:MAG: hypothetical protein U1E65_26375 [Myxococcota bacterium]